MAKVVVKSKVKKVKRKFPVEIKAPEAFNKVSLGTTNITDLKTFVGKSVKMNLMYITKSIKNQNVRLVFIVDEVSSGVASTSIKSYIQIPYYLNRFVKAGSDLVEDSFVCKTKNNLNLRVKPLIITKSNTSEIVKSAIREKLKELITKESSSKTAEEFIYAVTTGKIQLSFRNDVKKIFPIKTLEFKRIDVE